MAKIAAVPRQGHGPWSHADLLAATQIDVLRAVLHVLVLTAGGKSTLPDPWPRPGIVAPRRRKLDARGHAYLQAIRERHAQLHPEPEAGEAVG